VTIWAISDVVTRINYICNDRNYVLFGVITLRILLTRRTKRVHRLDSIKRF